MIFLHKKKRKSAVFIRKQHFFGRSAGIRTRGLLDPKADFKLFPGFYVVFNPFCSNPIHLQTSLTTRFPCVPKRCVVCSVVRNVPPVPAGFFHRQGRGAFFLHRTACIVTRREGLNKLFPRCPRLRNWRAVNKISEDDMCCYLSNLVWK